MSRPLRLEFVGALSHVTSRGNERKPIFRNESDFSTFIDVLGHQSLLSLKIDSHTFLIENESILDLNLAIEMILIIISLFSCFR
ncbi:hypothetical protein SAMN02745724_05166 [Pseudoalteromonas denitrificans DSM 6059]|uniref:Uncharacterized protein n=1 Tax=Pseudoalteromonas denitrificans DSM 6059 TaxID=1123010 RepID=A0A1I1UDW0_9GAMM|nr:hypothetical protein SAMN02745724_05166 [Pseudoalteromonas denitrificans DSM 6059]